MITFTGDGDIYDPRANNNRDMGFNNMAQLIYQITKKSTNPSQDQALARSMVIYSPVLGHSNQSNNLDNTDGEYGAIFTNGFGLGWLEGGWKMPLNPTWPQIDSIVESGKLDNEYAYVQYQHLKVAIAMQLSVHRLLGEDYPVPTTAFGSLGLRVDLMPTSCDVATHFEYMKVGPRTQISYDPSYNLQVTAPGLTITSTNNITPIGSATIKVDASSNVVLDGAKGMKFAGFDLKVDQFGNIIIG